MYANLAKNLFRRNHYKLTIFASLLLISVCLSANHVMANGTLDPTFGSGGSASAVFGVGGYASALIMQPDGKFVAAGSVSNVAPSALYIALARFNSNGSLDNTFGTGGKVITPVNLHEAYGYHVGLALQPDGKIVFASNAHPQSGNSDLVLVRYNSNGSLDMGFGTGGVITTNQASTDILYDVALQANGKIVVVGKTDSFTVGRYFSNGSLENLFITDFSDLLPGQSTLGYSAVTVLPNAQIFTCGNTSNSGVFARYNPSGTLDASFGTGGRKVDMNGCGDLVVLPDGKFYASGIRVIRYFSNATIDTTFSTNTTGRIAVLPNNQIAVIAQGVTLLRNDGGLIGKVATPEYLSDLVIQPDGKIVTLSGGSSGASGGFVLRRYLTITSLSNRQANFDNDEKTDIGVFRPSEGAWYIRHSTDNFLDVRRGYQAGDYVAPEPYINYFMTFVWRADQTSGAQGYFCTDQTSQAVCYPWGLFGDIPVGGDYDGDGKTDFTVFRSGTWHILLSANNGYRNVHFGLAGDKPVPGDYDHDGLIDVAVFRPSNGTWYALQSSNGAVLSQAFGVSTDRPVPGDYDGDGKTDFAVYRPSTGVWYLQQSTNGFRAQPFGLSTDKTAQGDYDGDGRTDIGVFRNGIWYLLQSTDGFRVEQFGTAGDIPLSPGYVNQ